METKLHMSHRNSRNCFARGRRPLNSNNLSKIANMQKYQSKVHILWLNKHQIFRLFWTKELSILKQGKVGKQPSIFQIRKMLNMWEYMIRIGFYKKVTFFQKEVELQKQRKIRRVRCSKEEGIPPMWMGLRSVIDLEVLVAALVLIRWNKDGNIL